MKYQLTALLAILQQAEYDRPTFWRWVRFERPAAEVARLNLTQPERWTAKLHLIRSLSGFLRLVLGAPRAVSVSAFLVSLPQSLAAGWLLRRAARRLRRLQSKGLTVIAVAGSYGKTSVKHSLRHLLSSRHLTLMTPESVNTPLGIAAIIGRLSAKHSVFIVELGEQKPGDLRRLIKLVRPDIAVVTPIGFAHSEHFGSEQKLESAFAELRVKPSRGGHTPGFHPILYLIDGQNRGKFDPEAEAIWYGTDKASSFRIVNTKPEGFTTKAVIHTPGFSSAVESPLIGRHQLVNLLPGLAILNLDQPIENLTAALRYAPAVPRRLELHRNPNGTAVIDNSYNTNPGSWQEMKALIGSLSLGKVVIITAGFVELEAASAEREHQRFADDLKGIASGTIIMRTRSNQKLRAELERYAQSHPTFQYAAADSLTDALELVGRSGWPLDTLWLEGGCRELYQ